jgi:SNF2 family DNA or RNA helicase
MLIHKPSKKLVLNLRDPDRITSIIPAAKVLQWKGHSLVAVPHRLDEVRVLNNMGIDAPSPILSYYDWPGVYPPFEHQRITAAFLTLHPRAFCLNDMGTGKTLSVLWAFHYLLGAGDVDFAIVVSPLSTLERTWGDEIFRNFFDLNFSVLHGAKDRRLKLLAEDRDIYVINHDGISRSPEILKALIAKMQGKRVALVIDELAAFRNAGTDRFKAMQKLVKAATWVWGLTGTPIPNAPTDAWAQCRLIAPEMVPPYFGKFREHVMRQVAEHKWVPREDALTKVYAAMQPAIRYSRAQCIDLPPTTYQTRQVDLSNEQKALYKQMMLKFKAEYEGGQITAVNAAAKVGKLLQIVCGVAYGDGSDIVIPAPRRIELVKETIEEAGAKVIVFVPLTGALEHLAAELRKDFTVAVVHGQTPKTQRDQIFHDFQKAADPQVLVAQPAAMSHGLTLTAADYIVWFAPVNSNEVYQQANARIVRPGQKRPTFIVNIEGSDLERKMYDRLQKKGDAQGALLDMFTDEAETSA